MLYGEQSRRDLSYLGATPHSPGTSAGGQRSTVIRVRRVPAIRSKLGIPVRKRRRCSRGKPEGRGRGLGCAGPLDHRAADYRDRLVLEEKAISS